MPDPRGLYENYTVIDNRNGQTIWEDTFVLMPLSDSHAVVAILAYAESVKLDNYQLYLDLLKAYG